MNQRLHLTGNPPLRPPSLRVLSACHRPLLAALLAFCLAAPLCAQTDDSAADNREYTIKAAYLYNFGRYVRWPDNTFRSEQDPFVIGVLGADPFGNVLDLVAAEKKIEGRKIVVRRFASWDQYAAPCHILFIARTVSPEEQTKASQRLQGAHVLLVGEAPSFTERGGAVSFFLEENRVRFEINQESAKREGLKISSKLLSLAKLVGNGGK